MQKIRVLAPYPVAQMRKLRHVVRGAGIQYLEYIPRRSDRQDEQEQKHRQRYVELAQTLDADVESREHRNGGQTRDRDYERDVGEVVRRNAEQVIETGNRLLGSQSERGGETEQRGEYGEHVYHVSAPAPHAVSQNRMKNRADGERQSPVEAEKRETETRDRVERPRGEPPVKGRSGYARGLGGLRVGGVDSQGRIPEIVHRLQHPEKQQSDGDSRREDHGEPGDGGVIGPGVPAAYAHPAHGRENQEDAEQEAQVGDDHEKPVELNGNPLAGQGKRHRRFFLKQQNPRYESQYRDPGDHEHRNVYVQTEYLEIVPPGDGVPLAAVHPLFPLGVRRPSE